jgi:excisionase family DNA binding protein
MMLTMAEAARELRCSRSHLYRIQAGRFPTLPPLPCIRLGRRLLIRRDALLSWLHTLEHMERQAQYAGGRYLRRIDEDPEWMAGA